MNNKPADFATLIRSCDDLLQARSLHQQISTTGHDRQRYLGNLLVYMFSRCGSISDACLAFNRIQVPNRYSWTILVSAHIDNGLLPEARNIFDSMPERDSVSWNAMIGAYARAGHMEEALLLLLQMDLEGTQPDTVSFLGLLDGCAKHKCLETGRLLHGVLKESDLISDVRIGNCLMSLYGKCNSVAEARGTFDRMQEANVVSWTTMIMVYAQNGYLQGATEMFTKMPVKNAVSWNSMISACSQHEKHTEALHFFRLMNLEGIRSTAITFICVLEAIASLGLLLAGAEVHGVAVETGFLTDIIVSNALVNMYGKCGRLQTAREIFEQIKDKDIMSWNVIITVSSLRSPRLGLEMYWRMNSEGISPNVVTFVTVLDACSELSDLREGRSAHERIRDIGLFNRNVILDTALVTMYGRCFHISNARETFSRIPHRDMVCWSAMLTACVNNGQFVEAVRVLASMDSHGFMPNAVTFISSVVACSSLNSLSLTRLVHSGITSNGFHSNAAVTTALIHAYGRCGSLRDAITTFEAGPRTDPAVWNALIMAYSQNELAIHSLSLFQDMVLQGVDPNEITYVNLLCSCSHSGTNIHDVLRGYFVSMSSDYGVSPGVDHYACVVDILGRAGRLSEAEELLGCMPYEPDSASWTSFLNACSSRKETPGAAYAAESAVLVDPGNSGPYVLLANMHRSLSRHNT